MNSFDQHFVEVAKRRGPVLIDMDNHTRRAILVAWKPRDREGRRRNVARVQFKSGARLSVPTSRVRLIQTKSRLFPLKSAVDEVR